MSFGQQANNAPIDLDRQLPSAKLALHQLRKAKAAAPPWTALIPRQTTEDRVEHSATASASLSTTEDDEQVFPRMLKYLSFIGAPFMFASPLRVSQASADVEDAPIPTPGEVFDNHHVPNALRALHTFAPITLTSEAMPAKRSVCRDVPSDANRETHIAVHTWIESLLASISTVSSTRTL